MVFLSFLFFSFFLSLQSLELYQFYFHSTLRPNPRCPNTKFSDWKFLFWISKCRRRRRRLEPTLIKLTDGDTMHGKNLANEILWASFSLFSPLDHTKSGSSGKRMMMAEYSGKHLAMRDSLYVVYNFNAAYSGSRECDRWWWRGRDPQCLHFFHMKIYIYSLGPYVDWLLNCYRAPQLLWFAVRWRALDFISISFSRSSMAHYTTHSVRSLLRMFYYSTHTHARIHTRDLNLLQLFCHVTHNRSTFIALHFTLLHFWYYFLLSSRILFLVCSQFFCHIIT